jgi:hypothetical protein
VNRNPRDIQREVVSDLGEFIRRNRMGLPLLVSGPNGKESKAQKTSREENEASMRLRSDDHVSVFLQAKKSSTREDDEEEAIILPDKVDHDEKYHIEQSILDTLKEFDEDYKKADDDSDSSSDSSDNFAMSTPEERDTNHELLAKNGASTRTEPVYLIICNDVYSLC